MTHRTLLPVLALAAIAAFSTLRDAEAGNRIDECGGLDQKACDFFVYGITPSCDGNLVDKNLKGICRSPSNSSSGGGSDDDFPNNCGDEGERPCTIVENIPSCKSGLVENFLDNECVSPGDGTQLDDVIANFEVPNCTELFAGTVDEPPTISQVFNYKLATGIPALLAEEIVPKDTVATPARVVAALAYLAIYYCELTLERDLAQDAADFEAAKFDEVLTDLGVDDKDIATMIRGLEEQVLSVAPEVSVELTSHDTDIKAAITAHDAAINTQLSTHDQGVKSNLGTHDTDIKAAIAAHDASINTQLGTHDQGVNAKLDTHDMDVKASITTHDTAISTQLSAHDRDLKAEITRLRDEVAALRASMEDTLAYIEELLLTPQGKRPGYNGR